MAVYEENALLRRKDADGNDRLIYPITTLDNVDGAETLLDFGAAQELTAAQKAQARENIDAASTEVANNHEERIGDIELALLEKLEYYIIHGVVDSSGGVTLELDNLMWTRLVNAVNYAYVAVRLTYADGNVRDLRHQYTYKEDGYAIFIGFDEVGSMDILTISSNGEYALESAPAAAMASALNAHTGNTSNPHGVTATQVKALALAGGTMDNNAAIKLVKYGNRYLTIDGNAITADMSKCTGGWAGSPLSVIDPAGDTTTLLGWYGGATGLTHIYMGGTYSDPYMKMTKAGQFTFKNRPNVGTDPVALKSEVTALVERVTDLENTPDWVATKEITGGDTVVIPEQSVSSLWSNLQISMQPDFAYDVYVDGVLYVCKARASGSGVVLGNNTGLSLNEYPFCIYWAGGTATGGMFFGEGSTLKVTDHADYAYNQMPEGYLPDGVAMKDDLPDVSGMVKSVNGVAPDENGNVETECSGGAYIINGTYTSDDDELESVTLDDSFNYDEMVAAIKGGRYVAARLVSDDGLYHQIFHLNYLSDEEAFAEFERNVSPSHIQTFDIWDDYTVDVWNYAYDNRYVKTIGQTLSEDEKAHARTNIGAVSKTEVDEAISSALGSSTDGGTAVVTGNTFYTELVRDKNIVTVICRGLTVGKTYSLHLYTAARRRGGRQNPWRHPSNENTGDGFTGKGYFNLAGQCYACKGTNPNYPAVPDWMPNGGILQTEWEVTATAETEYVEIPLNTWLLDMLKPVNGDFAEEVYHLIGVANKRGPLLMQFRLVSGVEVGECKNTLRVGVDRWAQDVKGGLTILPDGMINGLYTSIK